MYTEQNDSAKDEIASIIQKLEDVVRKMADSREEISDDNISRAYRTLNDIEIELQKIAGKVAGLKFKIEE
tara:strand:+ start:326 stop:535 length:210 start_codon:yes stop_codon:yes gene_type:complete